MHDVRKPLLWSQRLALLRHNLHIAHHTRDFTFFRTLQVQTLLSDEDHVALLTEQLDSVDFIQSPISAVGSRRSSVANTLLDADSVVANLDKLTAVIANVHEDAFTALAKHVRSLIAPSETTAESPNHGEAAAAAHSVTNNAKDNRSICDSTRTEAAHQRSIAAASVDKMLDAAAMLISQLPAGAQDEAVAVLTLGLSFVADAMAVALMQMDRIEDCAFDTARIDAAAASVSGTVSETVLALKGMFGLMDGSGESNQQPALRPAIEEAQEKRRRSVADASPGLARSWVRRISTALTSGTSPTSADGFLSPGRTVPTTPSSVPPAFDGLRLHKTKLSRVNDSSNEDDDNDVAPHDVHMSSGVAHKLAPIPPTPMADEEDGLNQFDFSFSRPSKNQGNQQAFESNSIAVANSSPSGDAIDHEIGGEGPAGKEVHHHTRWADVVRGQDVGQGSQQQQQQQQQEASWQGGDTASPLHTRAATTAKLHTA